MGTKEEKQETGNKDLALYPGVGRTTASPFSRLRDFCPEEEDWDEVT